jgi:hypothetical protein
MEKKIQNAILSNLNEIKESVDLSQNKEEDDSQINEDDPDELINALSKFEKITKAHSVFDYESKRSYFDEIYFKNSKLFKM